jgi:hypothetical protein
MRDTNLAEPPLTDRPLSDMGIVVMRKGFRSMPDTPATPGPPFTITADTPTPLLRDFEIFQEGVAAPDAYLTVGRGALDRATLYAIDQRMATHRTDTHPRTDQIYYPLLHLFQRICLAARFHRIEPAGGKLRMVPADALAAYRKSTPTEQYISLLEAFWTECDWKEQYNGMYSFDPAIEPALMTEALAELHAGQTIRGPRHVTYKFPFSIPGTGVMLRILSFFGFLTWTPAPPPPQYRCVYKGEVYVRNFALTPFGESVLKILGRERPLQRWNRPAREGGGAMLLPTIRNLYGMPDAEPAARDEDDQPPTEPFFEAFLPLFPLGTLKSGLPRAAVAFRKGTYVFKVRLGSRIWRSLALSDKHTLDDLHAAIQEAFNFDGDHLYAFHMDGRRHSKFRYNDPGTEDPPFADDAPIGQLELHDRQHFLYLYDFGDNWEFDVELLEVRSERHHGAPKVLERKGRSPQQYRRW